MDTRSWTCPSCQRGVALRLLRCPTCSTARPGALPATAVPGLPPTGLDPAGGPDATRGGTTPAGPLDLVGEPASIEPLELLWMSFGLAAVIGLLWAFVLTQVDSLDLVLEALFAVSMVAPTTMFWVAVIALGVRLGLGRR